MTTQKQVPAALRGARKRYRKALRKLHEVEASWTPMRSDGHRRDRALRLQAAVNELGAADIHERGLLARLELAENEK